MTGQTRERIYQFICNYVDEYHMPPTRQEIADWVGMSKPSVQRAIDILEARGKLKRERFKALPVR